MHTRSIGNIAAHTLAKHRLGLNEEIYCIEDSPVFLQDIVPANANFTNE